MASNDSPICYPAADFTVDKDFPTSKLPKEPFASLLAALEAFSKDKKVPLCGRCRLSTTAVCSFVEDTEGDVYGDKCKRCADAKLVCNIADIGESIVLFLL